MDTDLIKSLTEMVGDKHVAVFASTRDGEEKLIIDSYLKLKERIDSLLSSFLGTLKGLRKP
jgi:3-deoxy-D-manno-octulosonic-acid transferase